MKEQFRAILAGDLTRVEAAVLLDPWCTRPSRSRMARFVKVARTMRQRLDMTSTPSNTASRLPL